MGRFKSLGELEHLLMLSVMRLDGDAYGVSIRREVEERTGRSVSPGSIYPTMDRLEEQGLVESELSDPIDERGGRSRRYFRLTPEGHAILRHARRMYDAMWEGFEASEGSP